MTTTQRIFSSLLPQSSSSLLRIASRCTLKNGGMDKLIMFALMFLISIDHNYAIRCYRCSVAGERDYDRNTTKLCTQFTESDEYIVECPYSTMCLKTISSLFLQNGQTQETVTRGCAQQKDTTQVFENRQWQQKHSVQEVYEEGCVEFKENNLAGSVKTHCYCRGNLCNSALRNHGQFENYLYLPIIIAVIIVFNKLRINLFC